MNAQALQPSASSYSEQQVRRQPATQSFAWLAAAGGILIVAVLVRLYALELRPLHHDEGVNAFFIMRLFQGEGYQYDPTNYHGPTLYYLALVAAHVRGLTIFAMRLVPALCGVATVWLALCLRRYVSSFGALVGASLIAISPGAVYMSRYFIHESLFVFFTLGVVVAGFRYWETGRIVYLMCASMAAALIFATKETAIISAGVLVMAIFLAPLLIDIRKALGARHRPGEQTPQVELTEPRRETDVQVLPGGRRDIIRAFLKWVVAGALFILVIAFFYSSLFTNHQWLGDVLKSYSYWARTGRSEHAHRWYTYLSWLIQEEGLLLVLGLIGIGLILWRSDSRFPVFAAIWSCGLLGAYSIVPYKTPWLTLNFIIPLSCIGGYTANALRERAATKKQRVLVAGILGIIIAVTFYQMIRLNFLEYDDYRHPYVYGHTRRELLSLIDEVSRIADRAGTGRETTITITASEYWPLPWYLRDYRQVAYADEVSDLNTSLVIGSQDQESELQTRLRERYERVASYTLRPGVNLVLYARREKPATETAM
jgi:uncharacterized protein (TIGR03663 family)